MPRQENAGGGTGGTSNGSRGGGGGGGNGPSDRGGANARERYGGPSSASVSFGGGGGGGGNSRSERDARDARAAAEKAASDRAVEKTANEKSAREASAREAAARASAEKEAQARADNVENVSKIGGFAITDEQRQQSILNHFKSDVTEPGGSADSRNVMEKLRDFFTPERSHVVGNPQDPGGFTYQRGSLWGALNPGTPYDQKQADFDFNDKGRAIGEVMNGVGNMVMHAAVPGYGAISNFGTNLGTGMSLKDAIGNGIADATKSFVGGKFSSLINQQVGKALGPEASRALGVYNQVAGWSNAVSPGSMPGLNAGAYVLGKAGFNNPTQAAPPGSVGLDGAPIGPAINSGGSGGGQNGSSRPPVITTPPVAPARAQRDVLNTRMNLGGLAMGKSWADAAKLKTRGY